MVDVLMLVGFVLLIASILAFLFNRRVDTTARPQLWKRLWTLRWVIGAVLGVASFFASYPVDGTDGLRYSIHGIPFFAYAFDERGWDYVGPMSLFFMILNLLFWLLLPQFVLWVTSGRRKKRVQ